MKHLESSLPTTSAPVFFDPSGKRWFRILTGSLLTLLLLALSVVWVLPGATAPVWNAAVNQSADYPRKLLATGDVDNIPTVGRNNGIFQRIALVERKDDKVFLKDPFSSTVFRQATGRELQDIGDHPYVIDYFGRPANHQLMLTFDDGPDPRNTAALLDELSRQHVPATFFDVGQEVVKYPDLFRREVREGHMVANHSMSHIDFWANNDVRNREELIGTDRVMRAADSYSTRLFRIPTGDPDNNSLALLQAQQLGYVNVDFDLDTEDWSYAPGEPVPLPPLDGKGHVVLMHDGGGDRAATIKMLEKFIPEARAKGYTFTTLQPILPAAFVPQHNTAPTIDDHLTLSTMTAVLVAPNVIIGWLYWFGIISLSTMSILYVTLALVSRSRQKRRHWKIIADEKLPLVTVVLPVYNEEPVVTKTLDALRASDYPALEVIAVNDGSTDGTLAVLREYALGWPKLRVLDQPNGGKSVASNNGIAHAKGEIVVTLDGDTLFEPQTIRVLARHFRDPVGGKVVGAVAGHVKVGNRRNLLTAWQSLEYISGICVTRMAEGLVGAISIAPGACAAWRRTALVQARGYSHDTLAEDADLTLSIQRLGYSIVQENEAVAWTEAPMTVRGLLKQRLRWTYGNLQALYKHRGMLFRSRYGALGLVTLPYAVLSILIPLLFMPMTLVVAVLNLAQGQWEAIAIFAVFVAGTHMLISIVAIAMVRENPLHLLMVPIYRLIYEPLRAYVIYGALVQALKGRIVGWYKPERTNSVLLSVANTVLVPVGAGANTGALAAGNAGATLDAPPEVPKTSIMPVVTPGRPISDSGPEPTTT